MLPNGTPVVKLKRRSLNFDRIIISCAPDRMPTARLHDGQRSDTVIEPLRQRDHTQGRLTELRHSVNETSRNKCAVSYASTTKLLSLRNARCLAQNCGNLKQATTDTTKTVSSRFRYCLQDAKSFLNGIAPVGLGWPILCRRIGKPVTSVAATIDGLTVQARAQPFAARCTDERSRFCEACIERRPMGFHTAYLDPADGGLRFSFQ